VAELPGGRRTIRTAFPRETVYPKPSARLCIPNPHRPSSHHAAIVKAQKHHPLEHAKTRYLFGHCGQVRIIDPTA
jgi:hypothetical protein